MLAHHLLMYLYRVLVTLVAIVQGCDTMLFAVTSAVPGEVCEKHDMDFAIVSSGGDHR